MHKEILQRFYSLIQQQNNNKLKYLKPKDLTQILNLSEESCELDEDFLFSWIEKYLQYSVNTTSLHFNNRMWSKANLPSVLGEMVVALKNTSSCTYESAPVAVLMEKYMLDEMLDLVGFQDGEGQMTTGSSNANMLAMMIARNLKLGVKDRGLFTQKPLVAFVSVDSHYSFDKAANILGIGVDNLIKIPVDINGKMQINLLESSIKNIIKNGGEPFFIGATLGTTVRGAYDNITDILKIKEKYNIWLHGDGAWGGSVIVDDFLKNKLTPNIKELDSFTMDFHKMLGSALMCNFLLVKKKGLLNLTCDVGDTSYVFHDTLEPGVSSLQCGRRVDSLKWFLDWKFYKKSGFAKRIKNYHSLIDYTQELINNHSELELIAPRQSFNLCFNFKGGNKLNKSIRDYVYQNNIDLLSIAYINGILVFRFIITHENMNKQKITDILNNIIKAGNLLKNSN